MSEAIVKALDEAAGRVGTSLGRDAAKAVTNLYRDTSGKLTGVIERSVGTDSLHAGNIKQIADKLEHNAMRGDMSAADKAAENSALRDKLKGILDDKTGSGTKPVIKRQDDAFEDELNNKGVRKSHINKDGDLEPANPAGVKPSNGKDVSILDHVVGNKDREAKSNSPYTSFAPEDGSGKIYGAHEYHLDYSKMQGDIDSGKLQGVELHDPASVQNNIRDEIDKTAGGHFDLPDGELSAQQRKDFVSQVQAGRQAQGLPPLGKKPLSSLDTRVLALSNTRRDSEWLVKGTIPSEYLTKVR